MLEERQKDGAGSSNDGFYESRREWMGRRHFILAFEGYVLDDDQCFGFQLLCNAMGILSMVMNTSIFH